MLLQSMTSDPIARNSDLVSLFRDVAAAAPERAALSAEDDRVTYRRLDAWSDAVARILLTEGVRPGDRVALRMTPGAEAIVAILAILKCGAAYVPVDLRNPVSRSDFILADSGASALIGEPYEGCAVTRVVRTAAVAECRDARPEPVTDAGEAVRPGADDTAYVIYTSGTTGNPKGVPVRHANVLALLTGAPSVFDFTEDDRWLLFHSLSFDFSVWEIWGPFSTGAELVVLPHWAARTPEQYLSVIIDRGVTVINQTPTAFLALTEAAVRGGRDVSGLRYVIFGGEKLTAPMLRPWAKAFGLDRPRLVNGYGITETTVFTTFEEIGEAYLTQDTSVIGRALPSFRTRVVGDDGRDVALGETGELWLAGAQLAEGYLRRPELTAEKFPVVTDGGTGESVRYYRSGDLVSELPDGRFAYEGRADLQVKLRGYRIELSDIETAVRRHDDVVDAVVTVREFKPGDLRLVCAYVAREGSATTTARELRDHIKTLLPAYMHPARYLRLPGLPRTVNGKVDRAAVARSWEEEVARS
ncbi:amino acid adenylation domain-containing protein [Streptomyces himastatinicus]|nr:amino acid adenylation domain-containing protein [Streptomyces himastatinicus]